MICRYNMGLLSAVFCCLDKSDSAVDGDEDGAETLDLFFDLQSLQIATGFFSDSNLLGLGGFGPVFKGLMPNGQEIAVKKLSLQSRQGTKEFSNEVKLLLRIQHRNLVTLYGCCIEGPEKMLVYEYLPNRSLDYVLFDKSKSTIMDWPKRYGIIFGVAKGLLYLHEEAPVRIIHRDIKASNILLDEQLSPKIADFGLARLFPGDDTHLETLKAAGTYGYMAPEYAVRGYLSVKTDVFAYGVLLLEIVSGRKNRDYGLGAEKADLLSYAWRLYQGGKTLELVDPSLSKYNAGEAAMCIHLGLLCCQADYADRPTMSSVQLMLLSESYAMTRPGKPGIRGRQGRQTISSDAFTNTNTGSNDASSSDTAITDATKTSTGCSLVRDFSRNSVSISSMGEGR